MSPIIKKVKFPDVRVSEKLKSETEKAAEVAQENLSEYIRKAVEQRNDRVNGQTYNELAKGVQLAQLDNALSKTLFDLELARQNSDGVFPIVPLKPSAEGGQKQVENLVNIEAKGDNLQKTKPKK